MMRLLQAYRNRNKRLLDTEEHETEVKNLNSAYARLFKSKDGEVVLEHMVRTQMAVPIAQQGDDLITIGERQGRSNHVNEIIQRIENS